MENILKYKHIRHFDSIMNYTYIVPLFATMGFPPYALFTIPYVILASIIVILPYYIYRKITGWCFVSDQQEWGTIYRVKRI